MSNQSDYNQNLEAIKAVDDNDLKKPNMPVGIFIQEGDDLYTWCQVDRQILESKGLDWTLVEELPVFLGALSEIQSLWKAKDKLQEEDVSEWEEQAAAAYDLRNTLLRVFRYAFRNDREVLRHVTLTADGRGDADLIKDLSDLSVLGKAHPAPLAAIHFDIGQLDQAAETAIETASLLAAAKNQRQEQSEVRILRDKAYTLCKIRIDTIRTCGKFACGTIPNAERDIRAIMNINRIPELK